MELIEPEKKKKKIWIIFGKQRWQSPTETPVDESGQSMYHQVKRRNKTGG